MVEHIARCLLDGAFAERFEVHIDGWRREKQRPLTGSGFMFASGRILPNFSGFNTDHFFLNAAKNVEHCGAIATNNQAKFRSSHGRVRNCKIRSVKNPASRFELITIEGE